jgi:hypothetical protein
MSGQSLWNLVSKSDMFGQTWIFGGKIVFDDLHFTKSPNVSLLIVWSS